MEVHLWRNPVNPGNVDEGQGSQTCTRKLVQTTQSPEVDSNDRVSKHEVHKPSIHDEGLPHFAKEVGNYSRTPSISDGSTKDKCVDTGNVHVFVNESSHPSWTKLFVHSLFNITLKLILEHSEEILNVHTIERTSPSWTRSTLPHDQVNQ